MSCKKCENDDVIDEIFKILRAGNGRVLEVGGIKDDLTIEALERCAFTVCKSRIELAPLMFKYKKEMEEK